MSALLLAALLACSSGPAEVTTPGGASCEALPPHKEKGGTQGMKIWKGETYQAFPHSGEAMCVPAGWEPVGDVERGPGWASFPHKQTGVIVRSDAWDQKVVQYEHTLFPVRLYWSKDADQKKLQEMMVGVRRAFEDVGAIFPMLPEAQRGEHDVIITAGVAGDTLSKKTRVYPEPGVNLTSMFRLPGHRRAESLFIHAVGHLYNRHRPYWLGDQEAHQRVPPNDFSELEAAWTEHRFGTSPKTRRQRLEYLYNVHTAVQTGDFSLIVGPPFDEEAGFRKIERSVAIRKGANNMSVHYGHYIIGCLSMVATEGLLAKRESPITVEQLLRETHAGEHKSYLHAVEAALGPEGYAVVWSWMREGVTIPWETVLAGAARYDKASKR